MPPKKGRSVKKDAEGKEDSDGDIQGLLLEKDLEIETLLDKLWRLERRSQSLASLTEKQRTAEKEMEEKLQDVIACLTSELKNKEKKIHELEQALAGIKIESTKAIEIFTKESNDMKNTHKLVTEDLRLQLAMAQLQLHEIDNFRAEKTASEQEIAGLKEQLKREKKEHQDAINDVERAALQEKEKLRKEMVARIEETKLQMLLQMDDQLHAKTKRTIVENEHLVKELSYHMRQSELLLQKQEKLAQENVELHRQVLLAHEVGDDLARRNRMNQKTMRILAYRLREKYLARKSEQNTEEELKTLICQQEQPKSNALAENQELDKMKSYFLEQTRAVESVSSAEEAMKFLYACLDDIEMEKLSSHEHIISRSEIMSSPSVDGRLSLPSSLEQFTLQQRQEFLMHLLRTAVSLRAVARSAALLKDTEGFSSPVDYWCFPCTKGHSLDRLAFSVENILKMPIGGLDLYEPLNRVGSNVKSHSVGVQTEAMELEERLALEIQAHL